MISRWNFGPCRRELTRRLIETATEHYTECGDLSSIGVLGGEGGERITSRKILMGKIAVHESGRAYERPPLHGVLGRLKGQPPAFNSVYLNFFIFRQKPPPLIVLIVFNQV